MIRLLAVFRVDINLDGQPDYFFYGMDKKQENLVFAFYDKDLKPLFKDNLSNWLFPISTFEGLPLKNAFEDEFHWLSAEVKGLGKILVPAIFKAWLMPEEDNSQDILDRLPNRQDFHLYYLLPKVTESGVLVRVRAFDNFDFYEKVQKELGVRGSESVRFEKPFFQSKEDASKGQIFALVSSGKELDRRYYVLSTTRAGNWSFKLAQVGMSHVTGNGVFPLLDLKNDLSTLSESSFMTLYNRVSSRILRFDPLDNSSTPLEYQTGLWSDPLFNYIAGFNDDEHTMFLESRYFIHALDGKGRSQVLPINRDSSFPGVSFSETLQALGVETEEGRKPGVFINSTLIFGDRLYTMLKTEDSFNRPIGLSIHLPGSCVHLNPVRLGKEGVSHYSMLCIEGQGRASLKFAPVSLQE
jgi:hypothetical protein